MRCETEEVIFFSPTKTTLKVVEAVAEGMGLDNVSRVDLTFPSENAPEAAAGDAVIIGVPVYAGRVPALAVERLRQRVQGKGRPAVLVAVYGNRAYEDTLLELRNLAEELGFVPIAAGAFIGEHSFSTPELPVAQGCPNENNLEKARLFGTRILEKLQKTTALDHIPALQVPGNFPHRDGMQPSSICPSTKEDLCTLCGECASMCPSQVVRVTDTGVETDPSGCIWCGACIKACPTEARFWNAPKINEINTFLHTNHADPKEPETFL